MPDVYLNRGGGKAMRVIKLFRFFVLLMLFSGLAGVLSSASVSSQEKRIALVVGNGAYPIAARDCGQRRRANRTNLAGAGFDVIGAVTSRDTCAKLPRLHQKAKLRVRHGRDGVSRRYGMQLAAELFIPSTRRSVRHRYSTEGMRITITSASCIASAEGRRRRAGPAGSSLSSRAASR